MENKIISTALVSIVLAGGIGFYSGMKYEQKGENSISSQSIKGNGSTGGSNGANYGQRQQDQAQERQTQQPANGQGMRQGGLGGGFVAGQIISKDDSSLNIKTKDGSSKIIFFSDATNIDKSALGSKDDLIVGQQITANGKAGTDGSITAAVIQIRPSQTN